LPTARRMRGQDVPCLFCGFAGGDCIEHLIHCPSVLAGYGEVLPCVLPWSGPVLGSRRVALADVSSISECLASVVANDLLVYAYTARQHGHSSHVVGLMRARMRTLRLRGVIEHAV
jgi:hypothetical protein